MPVEKMSLLVGHKGSHVNELLYRKQFRSAVEGGTPSAGMSFDALDGWSGCARWRAEAAGYHRSRLLSNCC